MICIEHGLITIVYVCMQLLYILYPYLVFLNFLFIIINLDENHSENRPINILYMLMTKYEL